MKKKENILWGIVLIIIGLIIGLNALNITNINIFFKGWWTLIIIIPSFIDLFKDKDKTDSIIGLIIGILLFLGVNNYLDFDKIWALILPCILIVIGLSLIIKNAKEPIQIKEKKNQDIQEYCSTFGGQYLDFSEETPTDCELTAIFGAIKCDMSKSTIEEDITINASTIFGGVTILVPTDVFVKVKSVPIFGGVSNKRKTTDKKKNNKTIYINCTSIFGGVEIK